MENDARYTLGKKERLKSRKAIDILFKEGKNFSNYPLRVIYKLQGSDIANDTQLLQAGFTVSSRHFKKAVDRNRIKRLLREAYRLQKNSLTAVLTPQNKQLVIFIIYNGNEIPPYALVFEKVAAAIKRLKKIVDENQ